MTLETLLGYVIQIGLILSLIFAVLHGYYTIIAPPIALIESLPDAGDCYLLPEFGGMTPVNLLAATEEYQITSRLLWGTVTMTGALIAVRLFLYLQVYDI